MKEDCSERTSKQDATKCSYHKKMKKDMSCRPKKEHAMNGFATSALLIQIQSPNTWLVKCVVQRENAPETVFECHLLRQNRKCLRMYDNEHKFLPLNLYKCLQISDFKVAVPEVNVVVPTSTCSSNTNK